MTYVALCFSLFAAAGANQTLGPGHDRFDTCVEIAREADSQGVSPTIAISTAWVESRFRRNAVSPIGCCHGPLQINPRYFCPNGRLRNCDLIVNGVAAIKHFYSRYSRGSARDIGARCSDYSEWAEPLCHYNAGNTCTRSSRAYARSVIRLALRTDDLHLNY